MLSGAIAKVLLATNSECRFAREAKYAAGAVVTTAKIPIPEKDVERVNCVIISCVGLCSLKVVAKKFCIDWSKRIQKSATAGLEIGSERNKCLALVETDSFSTWYFALFEWNLTYLRNSWPALCSLSLRKLPMNSSSPRAVPKIGIPSVCFCT